MHVRSIFKALYKNNPGETVPQASRVEISLTETEERLYRSMCDLPPVEVLNIDMFTIHELMKEIRIPGCHNTGDSISVILDVQRNEENEHKVLKIVDCARVRAINCREVIFDDTDAQSELRAFARFFLRSYELYCRQCIARWCLRDLENVPTMSSYGFMSACDRGEFMRVAELSGRNFRAEEIFIEMDKVEDVISLSILKVLGKHDGRKDCNECC